MTSLARSQ